MKQKKNFGLVSKVVQGSLLMVTLLTFPKVEAFASSTGYDSIIPTSVPSNVTIDPWLSKPVLGYLVDTQDTKLQNDLTALKQTLKLSDADMAQLQQIGDIESFSIKQVAKNKGIENPTVFNQNVYKILLATDSSVQQMLGNKYPEFRAWVTKWWNGERNFRTSQFQKQEQTNLLLPNATTGGSGSFVTVWATQYDANTTYECALPDVNLKYSYQSGTDYSVTIQRNSSQETVIVKEVGPWNENDNYWDLNRREFTNLAQYDPEANEAYFNNYNNGYDDLGYKVLNQAGIDLSPAVAQVLGMASGVSAYVNVDFSYLP